MANTPTDLRSMKVMLIQQEYILALTIYSISLLHGNSLTVHFKEFCFHTKDVGKQIAAMLWKC